MAMYGIRESFVHFPDFLLNIYRYRMTVPEFMHANACKFAQTFHLLIACINIDIV
jgi:hypothetical protein